MDGPSRRALLVGERRRERRPVRQRRGHRPRGLVAAEQRAEECHLPQAEVARQARQAEANGRGHVPRLLLHAPPRRVRRPDAHLHRAGGPQRAHGLVDARLWRRVERLGKAHGLQARAQHRQHQLHQRAAKDLGRRHLLQAQVEARCGEQVEAEAVAHAAGAAPALEHLRSRHELLLERRRVGRLVVPLALDLAGVDDEDHVGDGDAGLGDVRAQHDLPDAAPRPLEGLRVLVAAEHAVQRQHERLRRVAENGVPPQALGHLRDLHEAGQEHQDRALVARHVAELRRVLD
mmetsp:Transcript_98088/g.299907  ORF Transcript_98088/g.299907 Transcript_98088/m.299907 type:complete len:290 (-) Transcript_98088:1542-2411(-)